MEWPQVMKTTVCVDVNINSPQMGQSHSVLRSMHRWEPSRAMDMQTPHFWREVSSGRRVIRGEERYLAVEKVFA